MQQKVQLAKGGFNILRVLHLSVVTGLTVFAIVAIVMVESKVIQSLDEAIDRVLQLIVIIAAVAAVFLGFKLFQKRLMAIRNDNSSAGERIAAYRTACVTWWMMLEIPGFLALIGFILTGNYAFFAVAMFLWLILLLFTPRKDNVVLLLSLNSEEIESEKF